MSNAIVNTVNTVRAEAISGFMAAEELVWLAKQAMLHKEIVEVGSWVGRSTRALADNTSGTVYAVDTWQGSDEATHREILKDKPKDWLKKEFLHNMSGLLNVEAIQKTSLEAAALFKGHKFDMIFIDASHNYEDIKADILAWQPLLTSGGLFCGHDYTAAQPGVVKAVDELIPDRLLTPPICEWKVSIWYRENTGA